MDPTCRLTISRRCFLKLTALSPFIGAAAFAATPASQFHIPSKEMPRFNPGFRIQKISDGHIVLCTQLGDGRRLTPRIRGLEADLLQGIEQEEPMDKIIEALCRRHRLSTGSCRERVNRALKAFEKDHWIYYNENLTVTRTEVRRV